MALVAGMSAMLSASGCAEPKATSTIDPTKVATVEIGRSTRADVFAKLGRPVRSERSNAGERWIYDDGSPGQAGQQAITGMGAATSIAGAFVPFMGLVGPGLSLAKAASGPSAAETPGAVLQIVFSPDGLVRDCVYISGSIPDGLPGAPATPPVSCGGPRAASEP